ncbi:hypothetical protein ACRQ5Q_17570 [Bradyrhizobium sp. PMVTL-01]|uniref:hypothetical protein n=1 Tax=Bradyrhizobium sp. PMVTL-01 TaxID=3434999 RepID=UPI003F70A494
MTFNTTPLPLDVVTAGSGKLITRKPLRPLDNSVRRIYVTQEVADLLDGKTARGLFPNLEAERLIAVFCAGHFLRVSRKKNDDRPDLERLEGFDEVWALCPRKPKPGWRLLGRFIDKDRLILLRAYDKHQLAKNYDKATKEVIGDWEVILGAAQQPFRGTELSDYLSGVYRDVDVKEE